MMDYSLELAYTTQGDPECKVEGPRRRFHTEGFNPDSRQIGPLLTSLVL